MRGGRRAVIEQYRITSSAGTPFYLATLLDEAERSGRDISSLSRFLVGAATVAAGARRSRRGGGHRHVAHVRIDRTPRDRRRIGRRPARQATAHRRPGRDRATRCGSSTSTWSTSLPARRARSWRADHGSSSATATPSLDAEAFVDGTWFRTGDQGRLDADGFLTITDRVKDIIIRGGENISAREVEDVLAEHPLVDEVAVCAAPDDTFGEAVCAFVRLRPSVAADPLTLDALRTFAAEAGLAAHKLPARLVVLDDFPRTAAGKVRKRDLRPHIP